jgi:hypothetical protein
MEDDGSIYEVVAPESAVPNEDGSYVKFIFSMRDGPPLALAIPSRHLFPLAALSFVAANQVCAIAGTLTNQQILQAESVEVYSDADRFDLHFRLTGTNTDVPIAMTWQSAQMLLQRLTASLARGSSPEGHGTQH